MSMYHLAKRRTDQTVRRLPQSRLCKSRICGAVEHGSPERIALRQAGVVEVTSWIVLHADPLHDPARRQVAWDGERHDLGQPQRSEAVDEDGPGCLRRVAPSPVLAREAPARFDRWGKRGRKGDVLQAHEAHERRDARHLHRPEAEPMSCNVLLETGGLGITLNTGEDPWKPAAYLGVGIQGSEDGEIRIPPRAEEQPGGAKQRRAGFHDRTSYDHLTSDV